MTQLNSKSIRYMKILPEDKNSEEDDALLREIKQIKEGVKTQEELVVT